MPSKLRVLAVVLVAVVVSPLAAAQSGRARKVTPAAPPPEQPKEEQPAAPPRAQPVAVNAKFNTKYAGGSLAIERDAKLTLTIRDGMLDFKTKNADFSIEAEKVTDVSYGTSVRERTAEGVGVGVVVPGLGGLIGKSKSTAHYIEIVWDGPPSAGVALRVDKDDYRGVIAALEGATGLKVRFEPAPLVRDWP